MAISRKKLSLQGNVLQTHLMDCETSAALGDLVRHDPTVDNKAVVATDNNEVAPIIGWILEKPSDTTCLCVLQGEIDVSIARGKLFLSASGGFTITPETVGYSQHLGESFGNGKIYFKPNSVVIKIV